MRRWKRRRWRETWGQSPEDFLSFSSFYSSLLTIPSSFAHTACRLKQVWSERRGGVMGELPPQDGRNLYEALETETLTTRFHCFLGRWNHRGQNRHQSFS